MEERALALAKQLGRVSADEETALETLCREACRKLERRLRPGVTVEKCGDALALAAAWMGLAGLLGGRTGQVRRFSAGDLTVEKDGGGAETLEQRARALMRPYVRDEDFVFRGVRG